ncbi:MAG: Gfo/Idh/MocA family oxidoreductase [bacterium]|nr:MAG: gfo/Idh/MocA family oxidoreductase [bacterium]
MIGVGIIGYGVMGRTHAAAYAAAAEAGIDCRLIGIYSRSMRSGGGNLAQQSQTGALPPETRIYTSADELLADERIHVVSICTHTDSHVELALAALAAGKHVIVEKPVALTAEAVRPLAEAAARASTLCMPAMCMRFWPGWPWLYEQIRTGVFGAVRSASFERVGAQPDWSPHFYRNVELTGGPLHELHVHDADFVLWCFGEPAAVHTVGDASRFTTRYRYGGGDPSIAATGGWVDDPGFPFHMRYRVEFEDAVADFAHDRDDPLLLTRGGETRPVPLPATTGYEAEVLHFLEAVRDGRRDLRVTMDDALAVARLLDAEAASLASGEPVSLR